MRFKTPHFFILAISFLLFFGCTSFNLSQTNMFINEDGKVISVDYGTGNEDYVTTFKSPMNGREMEFKSKLRVRVTMPDGTRFMAFQCMNELLNGTMYRSSDEKWCYQAKGFTCTVFKKGKDGVYHPEFDGVVCKSPDKPRKEQRR